MKSALVSLASSLGRRFRRLLLGLLCITVLGVFTLQLFARPQVTPPGSAPAANTHQLLSPVASRKLFAKGATDPNPTQPSKGEKEKAPHQRARAPVAGAAVPPDESIAVVSPAAPADSEPHPSDKAVNEYSQITRAQQSPGEQHKPNSHARTNPDNINIIPTSTSTSTSTSRSANTNSIKANQPQANTLLHNLTDAVPANIASIMSELRLAAASLANDATDGAVLEGPVIIGGSGGSGTRAVAKLLLELGVYVVVDDHNTWDVDEGFWVTAERAILPHTHSMHYALTKLPPNVRESITKQLTKFGKQLEARAQAGIVGTGRRVWGFKAPCSQVFLPFWKEIFPTAMFVHVTRDGRDIALSANREQQRYLPFLGAPRPVAGQPSLDPLARRVWLWGEINSQVKTAAEALALPYLGVKIEHVAEKRPAVVHAIRSFLSLPALSTDQVCCTFSLISHPMGTHDRRKATSDATFGKWHNLPAAQQARLLQAVQMGLHAMGYTDDVDPPANVCGEVSESAQCVPLYPDVMLELRARQIVAAAEHNADDAAPVGAGGAGGAGVPDGHGGQKAVAQSSSSSTSQSPCVMHPREIFLGSVQPFYVITPTGVDATTAHTPEACCELCRNSRGCSVFEFVYTHRVCKLVNMAPLHRARRESYWALGGAVPHPIPSLPQDRVTRRPPPPPNLNNNNNNNVLIRSQQQQQRQHQQQQQQHENQLQMLQQQQQQHQQQQLQQQQHIQRAQEQLKKFQQQQKEHQQQQAPIRLGANPPRP